MRWGGSEGGLPVALRGIVDNDRPAPDLPGDEPVPGKLTVGVHDGRAVHAEELGQPPFGRKPRAVRRISFENRLFRLASDLDVDRNLALAIDDDVHLAGPSACAFPAWVCRLVSARCWIMPSPVSRPRRTPHVA